MPTVTRRSFVRAAGAMGLLALAPAERVEALLRATHPGEPGRFLTAHELTTLTALTDRLLPGPPEDPTPGAVEAGVPQAIDLLLGAFNVDPPLIIAGGPFSNRAGSKRDDFAHFVPLDRQAELGWRIRLEGSNGIKEREFAGPVKGLQQIYREGLALLDELSQSAAKVNFAAASVSIQKQILGESRLQTFLGASMTNTLEAMYGPPEYGGNRNRVGWTSNGWAGDNEPRGYTPAEVSELDRKSIEATAHDAEPARPAIPSLPALSGRPASRDEWWLARRRLGR
jgi:hypothetical protein